MKIYEASARTTEEAIEKGLQELGVSIGDVDVEVLEEGSKGLFGLFGSRNAKVRLTVKSDEEDPLGDLLAGEAEKKPAKPSQKPQKAPERKPERKAEPEKKEEKPGTEKKTETVKKAETARNPETEKRAGAEEKPVRKSEKKAPAAAETSAAKEPAKPQEQEAEAADNEIRPLEKPEVTVIPGDQLDPESPAGTAYEFLKEITRLMGVEVTIEMGTDAEGNVYASMTGDTLGILIGHRGETLDALQYLTSLKVNRGREGYTRVTLDTENYRAKRENILIRLANRMANRAVRTNRRVSLEPMNPYERRIIHYALQKNDRVDTHSEGEEPNRHIVITLKK